MSHQLTVRGRRKLAVRAAASAVFLSQIVVTSSEAQEVADAPGDPPIGEVVEFGAEPAALPAEDAASEAVDSVTSAPAARLEEVVVTARRRRESAQTVPVALTAIGEQDLQATGTATLAQLQQLAPSLQVFSFNPRNTNINIRGLGANVALTNDGLENGVGVYVDQVYIGRPGASQFELLDLERVEVLRGPQGTLFGKNTTAGAINISSRLPSFTPEFSGEMTLGNDGLRQVRGSASGGINDELAARLSVGFTDRDGYEKNVNREVEGEERELNDMENFSGRGQLLYTPLPSLQVRLIADYSRQRQNCCASQFVDFVTTYDDGTAIPNNFVDRVTRLGYTPLPIDPFARKVDLNSPPKADMAQEGLSGQLDWGLKGATLTSVTAWRAWDWDPANDTDGIGLPVSLKGQQVNRQKQFSQELRLASDGERKIDYLAGLYYFWQVVDGYSAFEYGEDAGAWFLPTIDPTISDGGTDGPARQWQVVARDRQLCRVRAEHLEGGADFQRDGRLALHLRAQGRNVRAAANLRTGSFGTVS